MEISELRKIGWTYWDPIGIRADGSDAWKTNAADEYDNYLIHVVGLLRQGSSPEEAIQYLNLVATEHMALGPRSDAGQQAAAITVQEIARYLDSILSGD